MLPQRRFRLATLGKLELSSSAGEVFHVEEARPRHLAVLTVLALARNPIRREVLVEMFWGGETDDRARHTLSNALSALRGLLGPNAITARNDAVAIDETARIEVDALQFSSACELRDDERAALLYGGEFLRGVTVPDAEAFDRWLARERGRFAHEFQQVCERLVPALLRAGRPDGAAKIADRWLESAPESPIALTSLIRARSRPPTPVAIRGALTEFDRIAAWLWREYEIRPHAAAIALVGELREELGTIEANAATARITPITTTGGTAPTPVAPRATPQSLAANPIPHSTSRPPRRRRQVAAVAAALLLLVGGGFWISRRRNVIAAETKRPIVAVTAIDDVAGDTAVAWLRAGLPRLIASDLDAMGGIEVVAPSRVREVTMRLAQSSAARITEDQAIDIARRVGATWVVLGGVSSAKGGYLLDLTAREVAKPEVAQSFTLLSPDLMELGRLAASRLATALNVESGSSGARAQFADVSTANPAAYHYFMRGMTSGEGGNLRDAAVDLDSAIAQDSGFIEAVRERRGLAVALGDERTAQALAAVATKYAARLPEFDRLSDEIRNLDTLGESARANALSEEFVARFPHDPRSHSLRADIQMNHGKWAEAELLLVHELALDSLAMSAGSGPCIPCEVLWRLSQVRLLQGNVKGAEEAARRWVALQPELPAAWNNLTATLAATGRGKEALDAGLHVMALSKDSPAAVNFGRSMLSARRYDIVDSLVAAWRTSTDPILVDGRRDLHALVQRERGQFAGSLGTLLDLPPADGLVLMRADGLARTGRLKEAREILEWSGHVGVSSRTGQLTPSQARGYTWAHALEADMMIRNGDTSMATALIDSLRRTGTQSSYGRDHILYHHAQGMLYLAEHRYADAERELKAAEWSSAGWTRTNVELAHAQLALGHTADALVSLREAYLSPVDAMGRYVTRSELDWWMARVFAASGQRDSARVYATYVRSAWRHADAMVIARLDSLPAER